MLHLVARFNSRGPTILALGIILGLAWPAAADFARPAMTLTVFLFVLGSLLRVDAVAFRTNARNPTVFLILPFVIMIVAPILAAAFASSAGLHPDIALALVLAVSAPPTTTTIAVARMLGFDGAAPLVATLVATAVAPFTVPLVADLFGGTSISALALAKSLGLIVGSAVVVAIFVRRFASRQLQTHGEVLDALVVVALLVFSLATMSGVRERIEQEPLLALGCILLAYGCNIAFQIFGALLFPGDLPKRMIVGLTLGNKNVGLVWAALGAQISPTMALYFAASQLPIFTLPRVVQAILREYRRRQPIAAVPVPGEKSPNSPEV